MKKNSQKRNKLLKAKSNQKRIYHPINQKIFNNIKNIPEKTVVTPASIVHANPENNQK